MSNERKLSRLDLNMLLALDALITERSVSRAAERLGLSQPALSASLARIRRFFDDPILVRSTSPRWPRESPNTQRSRSKRRAASSTTRATGRLRSRRASSRSMGPISRSARSGPQYRGRSRRMPRAFDCVFCGTARRASKTRR